MFDRGGNYAQIIVGSESRVFGAKTFCAFGTYSVDEAKKLLDHAHRVLFGRQAHRHRPEPRYHVADGGELKYSNPVTAPERSPRFSGSGLTLRCRVANAARFR